MKKFACLVFVLFLGVASSYADILRTESGEVHNGQLTAYDSDTFLFEVKEAKGIFLGRKFPEEEVAKIVLSSSEDFLHREYQRLSADEILRGTTTEVMVRPTDELLLVSGSLKKGRMKGFEDAAIRFDISSSTEALNVQTIPVAQVQSVTLSNAEYSLSERLEKLKRLLQVRKERQEEIAERQTKLKKADQERKALAESVATETKGSIYDDIDYEKYLRGNTFEILPEEVFSVTPSQVAPYGEPYPEIGPSRDIEGLDRSYRDSTEERRRRTRDNDRPLKNVPLRERREESRSPRLNYPVVESVEVIGTGENQIVLYHRRNPDEE